MLNLRSMHCNKTYRIFILFMFALVFIQTIIYISNHFKRVSRPRFILISPNGASYPPPPPPRSLTSNLLSKDKIGLEFPANHNFSFVNSKSNAPKITQPPRVSLRPHKNNQMGGDGGGGGGGGFNSGTILRANETENDVSNVSSTSSLPVAALSRPPNNNKAGNTHATAASQQPVVPPIKLPPRPAPPACPNPPPNLNSHLVQNRSALDMTWAQLGAALSSSFSRSASPTPPIINGCWAPTHCKPAQRVAIVVPYRNRLAHLKVLLHNLHPFLHHQLAAYCIILVDQTYDSNSFNRAALFNVGVTEALHLVDTEQKQLKQSGGATQKLNAVAGRNFSCFIFHDVDLIPENEHNLYLCGANPRHLSAAIDKFQYKLLYKALFGGASAVSAAHVIMVNGYSNAYWGWGGEDDDFWYRLRDRGLSMARYPMSVARYSMIKHEVERGNTPNPRRFVLLKRWKLRSKRDGLNSLRYSLSSPPSSSSNSQEEGPINGAQRGPGPQHLTFWVRIRFDKVAMNKAAGL